ncbi:hypothetical protein A7U60_g3392 [Sanghuangporus baumii]|uniref:Glycoside hydrolase 131 catalytic N-terminal domain-containing protein n=1 Tax=Sanghuangporus baumii TaxID=108892 RepID=A0A9Q5NA69_SANBA|nr:hypothetical protein A7U60_g3392 [Sanghuangporus baumii]
MLLASGLLLTFVFSASASYTEKLARSVCTLLFDGKIPADTQAADFDADSSVYDNENVLGQNQTWADIIEFPDVSSSLVYSSTVVMKKDSLWTNIDVTLSCCRSLISLNRFSDESIFAPGGQLQSGFRRSELIPAINDGTDITVQGTTTVHWSLRSDSSKPFNLSHEYQLVFHETSDFSTSQFMLKTGAPFGQTFVESEHKTLRLEGRQTTSATLFSTPFDDDVWHNFAVTVAWNSTSITVFYSKNSDSLSLANVTSNDNSGQGQQHFGILKLPTGDAGIDVAHEGFQESGLNEGLIYGGIFIEDSSDGCITLS